MVVMGQSVEMTEQVLQGFKVVMRKVFQSMAQMQRMILRRLLRNDH